MPAQSRMRWNVKGEYKGNVFTWRLNLYIYTTEYVSDIHVDSLCIISIKNLIVKTEKSRFYPSLLLQINTRWRHRLERLRKQWQKTAADTAKLLLMTNRKSHMSFRLTPRSRPCMTLNSCKVKFCRNFAWFRDFGRQQWLNEWRQTRNVCHKIVAH